MFHVKHVQAAARYAGIDLGRTDLQRLETYADWLRTEGHRAGGIGPGELERLEQRHLADSVLFASLLDSPATTWDLGTGVGMPGIPLAVVMPNTSFVLIDRSGRRTDLVRRVIRILDLENCEVVQGEVAHLEGTTESVVTRASLHPDRLRDVVTPLLAAGGRAIAAGSWVGRPEFVGWETVEIPQYVLDHTIWLLMMRQT